MTFIALVSEESEFALKEAIRLAQLSENSVVLEHSLVSNDIIMTSFINFRLCFNVSNHLVPQIVDL